MMNFEFKTARKYLEPLALVVLVLVSIKPAIFTWHLIRAGNDYRPCKQQAAAHMYKCLLLKPSVYRAFKKYHPGTADNLVIKSAIYNKNIDRLKDSRPEPADISRIKSTFKDNFYLRHLFHRFLQGVRGQNPENLDDVSLELLADPTMNTLTISIFKKIAPSFSRDFVENLGDFCRWKGNHRLADYLTVAHDIEKKIPAKPALPSLNRQKSTDRLKEILPIKYKRANILLEKNLLKSPGFNDGKEIERHWYFSDMAGFNPFADASFTMGPDSIEKNGVLRVMGFFVDNKQSKSNARGGAWCKKRIPIKTGHYLFSFDYTTKTGKEGPSFYLGEGIGEKRIPAADGKWKKAIFILDNAHGKLKFVKPLIRIWGTGSLWVDNVFLARVNGTGFSLPNPNSVLIADCDEEKSE